MCSGNTIKLFSVHWSTNPELEKYKVLSILPNKAVLYSVKNFKPVLGFINPVVVNISPSSTCKSVLVSVYVVTELLKLATEYKSVSVPPIRYSLIVSTVWSVDATKPVTTTLFISTFKSSDIGEGADSKPVELE
jgi:hypothetical protein